MHTFDKNIKDLDLIIPDIAIPIANYVPYKLFNNNDSVAKNLSRNLNKRPEELNSEMFYKIAIEYEKLLN